MKKWVVGFLGMALIMLIFLYILIPDTIALNGNTGVKVTQSGLYRMLINKNSIQKWWPGEVSSDMNFSLHGYDYRFYENISALPVTISDKKTSLKTSLYLISLETDSIKLAWVGAISVPYNPIFRWQTWKKANRLNQDMNIILKAMKTYYTKDENIYGIKVLKEFVKDSLLVSTLANSTGYPTTPFIYHLVAKLRNYAYKNSAKETGFPMLNIQTKDSVQYEVKVALPLDRPLPNSGDISEKRMLGKGNILVTEIKGGIEATSKAFTQINQYAIDYQRIQPAIAFYSLVSDRTIETDSTKWITKIYCPIR